ncbi:MAG: flagellar filament capping protein FliD [Alphaproteobacteria bacterium]|nr:flagellar filament capping protein FliD [Alphaproteobacteria bacterium]
MVTQIQLGNLFQQNGRTVVGGGQTAFDTESIINSLVEAKRLPAVTLEKKNETIGKQQEALTDLRGLMSRFKSAVDTLRNPPGVGNAAQNIFQYRVATLTTNTGVAASNYVTATVEPGAATQTFTVDSVDQLARETKQQSDNFLLPDAITSSVVSAVSTPGTFTAGTFNLRRLGGGSTPITLDAGDSLQTVANKFNEVKSATGIQATVLKVADGVPNNTYTLVFTATKTGLDTAFDLENAATVTSDPSGVLSNLNFATTQSALNSQFTLDGVAIQRQTNSVADAIDGITFNLKQVTPALTSVALTIEPDTEIVTNAITQLADVYNELRLFVSKQSEVGKDGLPLETAVLANNSTLRSIMNTLSSEVSSTVSGITGGNPSQLADLGIKFQDFEGDEDNPFTRNIIVLDSDKLKSALESNYDGVRAVFEFQMNSQNANLAVFKRNNSLAVNDITLTIDRDPVTPIYTATYNDPLLGSVTVNLDGTDITSTGGVFLKGQNGTVLEGLELIFSATTDETFDVSFTQGIGDRLFNAIESIIDDEEGLLTGEQNRLEDVVTNNEEEITDIDTFIARYREQLIAQYSRLEEALSKANNLLQLLGAQADARNSA